MSDVDAVTTFYGRWAPLYDLVARRTPGIPTLRARAADALGLGDGDTVVEMGCGTGANAPHLSERVGERGRVVGLDVTRGTLEHAAVAARRAGRGHVHYLQADAARPPVRTADGVLGTFVVGMFDDPATAVDRWCDLVDPGGRIALLDAAPSRRREAAPLNVLFDAFVRVTAPPGTKLRYVEPPAESLRRRVDAARDALASRGDVVVDETHALGFLRLTAARL